MAVLTVPLSITAAVRKSGGSSHCSALWSTEEQGNTDQCSSIKKRFHQKKTGGRGGLDKLAICESQSLEDTQVEYISQKYTLRKYTDMGRC